jgi:hypothetical protein
LIISSLQNDGSRGGPIAGFVVNVLQNMTQEHGPHILIPIRQLDQAPGNDGPVIKQLRRAMG